MASNYAEFRFGWPVVVSAAIGIGLGMSPLPFYTLGVFAAPLGKRVSHSLRLGLAGWLPSSSATVTIASTLPAPGQARAKCSGKICRDWQTGCAGIRRVGSGDLLSPHHSS